jgi:hypothetical protein
LLANEQQSTTTADRLLIDSVKLEQQRDPLAEYNFAQEGTQNWSEGNTEGKLHCVPTLSPKHPQLRHETLFERRFAAVCFQAEIQVIIQVCAA